ncbi:hypothetical protein EST38_g1982 [Candolleomyces aberdarensis]|uniref:DUF202 domain-containing protein n=1 Tax=Candolleomyces aberdarensis TaxID=2316362 RepID=A0A4Q2DTM3_9AGAR|nr:hypothetical protein EST38_g1982 [Candolleomyces aberdarensis]
MSSTQPESHSSYLVPNTGSTARDYCMLERNLLSHIKLALLLSVLSASILLRARLVPIDEGQKPNGGTPLASVEFAAAILCIVAGGWEYYQGYWDLRTSRPFLVAPKIHLTLMSLVATTVFGTCIALLVFA